jgi:superfamily II DNA or RNA helicase
VNALTDHQAKLFALELLRRHPAGDTARIGNALMDAQVDLNPHQVDAALFSFRSPFSKGVILADEVGLGKTIEAGLVLTQRWAEGKRRVLVIAPASLRKQWVQELADKFFLPTVILETKTYNAAVKAGNPNPFDLPTAHRAVIVCSYQFAARKADELAALQWDLAILDEAHRLRNVYKPGARIATAIRTALSNTPKLLLTATPLQNSLMELYGLVSIIDEHHFGDAKSFRAQYSRLADDGRFEDLKSRLEPVCHRTLRRQVVEYVSYTNRVPITQEFWPSEDEQRLYDLVSDYLRRPELQALPAGQRVLMVLVMRKLLASSTFAIAGALDSLSRKLQGLLKDDEKARARLTEQLDSDIEEDFEQLPELTEEWAAEPEPEDEVEPLTEEARLTIAAEIDELAAFRDLAVSINENAKGIALLQALKTGFQKAAEIGADDKAIIFTESRRTQDYLVRLLSENGYRGEMVLFNGSNNDADSKATYQEWKARHSGGDQITGSPTADMRSALVDRFRSTAKIMIATEAAAEGINLQFCSMVVNYDLPWNPQRIEQRIGRCHRYGQQHDVVVINFLNRANAADQRVFELLSEKFRLFSGVFGASDEVLGAIESGVDFERRIVAIYQDCRTTEAIEAQFTQLQLDLDSEISETMNDTRQKLLEHFDAEVHDRLKVSLAESNEFLDRAEEQLWRITCHVLADEAQIHPESRSFVLDSAPTLAPDAPTGRYVLTRTDDDDSAHRYRRQHPLAVAIVDAAANLDVPEAELAFDYTNWGATAEAIRPLIGQSGCVMVNHLQLAGEDVEDHLLMAACTDEGVELTSDQIWRLLNLPAHVTSVGPVDAPSGLGEAVERRAANTLQAISEKQGLWFDEEMEKLDRWAEDKRTGLRMDLREHDEALKRLKREARQAASLPEKLAIQKNIKQTESSREEAWRAYDGEARTVEQAKDAVIDDVETRLAYTHSVDRVLTIRFAVT